MDELLKVENLSISFKGAGRTLEMVSGISFSVKRGEVLALVGESGCGKSISCLSLTRLLPSPPAAARADRVLFDLDGKPVDLFRLAPRELRRVRGKRIAYVFQEPAASLNPVMKIGDQIAEVLELHRPEIKDQEAEVVRLLEQVGISDPASRLKVYPHELSGGMQQRVMIAMALAGDPELLIADEPTTALDVTIQAQILELLDRLRRSRNMAVLLISHNLGVVAQLADRIAVMYAGTIVETGNVADVIAAPAHPYTRALLKAVPRLGGNGGARLCTIPGFVPAPEDFAPGCRFCDRCELVKRRTVDPELCRAYRPPLRELHPGRCCACHALGTELQK